MKDGHRINNRQHRLLCSPSLYSSPSRRRAPFLPLWSRAALVILMCVRQNNYLCKMNAGGVGSAWRGSIPGWGGGIGNREGCTVRSDKCVGGRGGYRGWVVSRDGCYVPGVGSRIQGAINLQLQSELPQPSILHTAPHHHRRRPLTTPSLW